MKSFVSFQNASVRYVQLISFCCLLFRGKPIQLKLDLFFILFYFNFHIIRKLILKRRNNNRLTKRRHKSFFLNRNMSSNIVYQCPSTASHILFSRNIVNFEPNPTWTPSHAYNTLRIVTNHTNKFLIKTSNIMSLLQCRTFLHLNGRSWVIHELILKTKTE